MELIRLIQENLLSPHLLFFAFGILARLMKSDLAIPEQISKFLFIYLMLSIGFKGGVTIAATASVEGKMVFTILGALLAGFCQPFLGFLLLRSTTQLDRLTSAAVAAHYGSVSVVTFVAAINFLGLKSTPYAGYMVAIMAMMEAPAILSGLLIAYSTDTNLAKRKVGTSFNAIKHIVTNGALLLLVASFIIGLLSGPKGMQKLEGFLVIPFQGILVFFLLDMGLVVAKYFGDLKHFTLRLALFGIYMPLLGAAIGLGLSMLIGLDKGTGFLLMVLLASASYIAVTAAMRAALPQAKVAIYLPLSLGITFPFNITMGIPLYFMLAERFLG